MRVSARSADGRGTSSGFSESDAEALESRRERVAIRALTRTRGNRELDSVHVLLAGWRDALVRSADRARLHLGGHHAGPDGRRAEKCARTSFA